MDIIHHFILLYYSQRFQIPAFQQKMTSSLLDFICIKYDALPKPQRVQCSGQSHNFGVGTWSCAWHAWIGTALTWIGIGIGIGIPSALVLAPYLVSLEHSTQNQPANRCSYRLYMKTKYRESIRAKKNENCPSFPFVSVVMPSAIHSCIHCKW